MDRRGLFINMARSTDRLAHMRSELRRFGLADIYRRLHAIDDPESPVRGCFTSHVKALEAAKNLRCIVHIVEDDVLLSSELKAFLFSKQIIELLDRFDLLFLDMWVKPQEIDTYLDALRRGGPLDMKGHRVGSTASYVVSPRRAAKVHKIIRDDFLGENHSPAIDDAFDRAVQAGTISAATMFPFLTGVDLKIGTQSYVQSALLYGQFYDLLHLRTAFSVVKSRQPHFAFAADLLPPNF